MELGVLLRDAKLKGRSSFENCLVLARESLGDDREGYRAEFINLFEKSIELKRSGQQARLE